MLMHAIISTFTSGRVTFHKSCLFSDIGEIFVMVDVRDGSVVCTFALYVDVRAAPVSSVFTTYSFYDCLVPSRAPRTQSLTHSPAIHVTIHLGVNSLRAQEKTPLVSCIRSFDTRRFSGWNNSPRCPFAVQSLTGINR